MYYINRIQEISYLFTKGNISHATSFESLRVKFPKARGKHDQCCYEKMPRCLRRGASLLVKTNNKAQF